MDIDKLMWASGMVVLITSAIIENLSKQFKPWTFIFQWIGKKMNAETIAKLDSLEQRIGKLETYDKEQDAARKESETKEARRRIITFADEIRRNVPHSQEAFDNILEDVTAYNNYCRSHPDFQNEKAVRSIASIDQIYDKCMKENSFL